MELPELVSLAGKGNFFFADSVFESSFVLNRTPHWIGITAEDESLCAAAHKFFPTTTVMRLSGNLTDGRAINDCALSISRIPGVGRPQHVELTALEGVIIGQSKNTPPFETRYHLTNFFEGTLSLLHDGWDIETILGFDPELARELTINWQIPVEGMTLQLRRAGANIEQHQRLARDVMGLLSLASGTGVSCHRQLFFWDDVQAEIWRRMVGDEIGPGPIVPEIQISVFLRQALPVWQSLAEDQRKAFRLAVHDINLSARGYLDTRLFHVAQPWEFLADAWNVHGALTEPETCLRSQLQRARKEWNEDHKGSDASGFWGSRISSLFDWPKMKDGIEKLAATFGLDLERMGLNLNLLKKARDSVAHSGKLSDQIGGPNNKTIIDLLLTGQYCLQLLLLRILGYQGKVYHASDGWQTIIDIKEALTKPRM